MTKPSLAWPRACSRQGTRRLRAPPAKRSGSGEALPESKDRGQVRAATWSGSDFERSRVETERGAREEGRPVPPSGVRTSSTRLRGERRGRWLRAWWSPRGIRIRTCPLGTRDGRAWTRAAANLTAEEPFPLPAARGKREA